MAEIAPIPFTGYRTPRAIDLPDLSAAKVIGLDTETRDEDLETLGPGAGRRPDTYIVGISVATDDGYKNYFPMRHENGDNMNPDNVLAWAKDNLTRPNQPKVGANIMYDLDFLAAEGVNVTGPHYDVQVAEPLIDENSRSFALETLGQKYLNEGKEDTLLYQWLADSYGGKATRKAQAGRIWRAPPAVVGPYAISDADLPIRVLREQTPILRDQGLAELFTIETKLIPLLLAMRRRGVRVNVEAAEEMDVKLMAMAAEKIKVLEAVGIEYSKGATIKAYCDAKGIDHPKTAKGNPSFQKTWLENHPDPILQLVPQVRHLTKFSGTFLQGYIDKFSINGRIHAEFNQLKSDEYGTVSGRFSSSKPNLQNIPVRSEEGKLIRAMFIPDEGGIWYSDDWSQIEYRLLVHFASADPPSGCLSARTVRQQYLEDPTTDFHAYVADMAGIPRGPAKNINFGLVYGMGPPKMAANMGRTLAEVEPIFEAYHKTFPFVKEIYRKVQSAAKERGYIRTLLGRRRRFPYWEPADYDLALKYRNDGGKPLTKEHAEENWPKALLTRAYTHKALNGELQGSAADIMKKAMVDIWESGVCDVLGAPLLTVHDELNWTAPRTPEAAEAHREAVRIMETCVPLRVPLLCDAGEGDNWGEAH